MSNFELTVSKVIPASAETVLRLQGTSVQVLAGLIAVTTAARGAQANEFE